LILDEVREDLIWAVRNDKFSCPGHSQQYVANYTSTPVVEDDEEPDAPAELHHASPRNQDRDRQTRTDAFFLSVDGGRRSPLSVAPTNSPCHHLPLLARLLAGTCLRAALPVRVPRTPGQSGRRPHGHETRRTDREVKRPELKVGPFQGALAWPLAERNPDGDRHQTHSLHLACTATLSRQANGGVEGCRILQAGRPQRAHSGAGKGARVLSLDPAARRNSRRTIAWPATKRHDDPRQLHRPALRQTPRTRCTGLLWVTITCPFLRGTRTGRS